MNKIFKVVWSKSKNCYVVVSEFAKNNSGKKKIVVAAILAALAMTNASISMAANTLPTNMHATAVGLGAGASVIVFRLVRDVVANHKTTRYAGAATKVIQKNHLA